MKVNRSKEILLEQVHREAGCSFLYRYDRLPIELELGYHHHREMELQFVSKGYGMHLLGGISEESSEGEVILIPGEVPHAWFWDQESTDLQGRIEEFTVQFSPESLLQQMTAFPELSACAQYLQKRSCPIEILGEDARSIRMLLRLMQRQKNDKRLLSFLSILLIIYHSSEIRPISLTSSDWENVIKCGRMERVYAFMLKNFHRKISLDEVANIACMNRSAFCSYFKRVTGKTFSERLNEFRINKACLLLSNKPTMGISDICYASGFNDLSHFNRVFKRFKGSSPKKYRGHS